MLGAAGPDRPALLPDGSPSELSVSRVLTARGQVASATPWVEASDEMERDIAADDVPGLLPQPGRPVTGEDQP